MDYKPQLPYPWLQNVFGSIEQSFVAQRLHHALLLKGPEGVGKWQLASFLAAGLLCVNSEGLIPCGQCKSCRLTDAGNHPDCCLIDNGQDAVGIDEVRRAGEFVNKKAHIGQNQIVLIRNIEHLTEAAANALLKTLEEPTKHVYLLLTCNAPQRLLRTILSRCHQQMVNVHDKNQAISYLTSQVTNINVEHCDILLQLSNNAPLRVLAWLHQISPEQIYQAEQSYTAWRGNQLSDIAYAKQVEKNDFARLLLFQQLKTDLKARLSNVDSAQDIAAFGAISHIVSKLNQFSEADNAIKGQNTNLALTNLLVQVRAAL